MEYYFRCPLICSICGKDVDRLAHTCSKCLKYIQSQQKRDDVAVPKDTGDMNEWSKASG